MELHKPVFATADIKVSKLTIRFWDKY